MEDFEMIITQEELESNHRQAIKKTIKRKKLKLKKSVLKFLFSFVVIILILFIFNRYETNRLKEKINECAVDGLSVEVLYTSTGDVYYGCANEKK